MTTYSAHPLLQMLGLGQVPQAVKPGIQMRPGFMNRINDGVRRSAGMPQQRFPLQGYPENPSLQGQPPLQWSAPNHAGGEMQLTNAGGQVYGMPAGPQRDSTTAVPMGGWQNHPSTRGLQEYKPTTPLYQRLHDITNPAPSPLIGNPSGGGSIPVHYNGSGTFSYESAPRSNPLAPNFIPPGSGMRPANGAMTEMEANRFVDGLTAQENQHRNWIMGNARVSPENSSLGVPGLNATPRSAMYPAHPYANKFPIQHAPVQEQTPVTDNGMSNRAILAKIHSGEIPSNLIPVRPGMTPEQAKAASDQAFARNKAQWAISDQRRAENATRDFEASKLALQRRNELRALRGKRGNMAENWIQSQYRQENPALFAQGVNPDMLRFMAAANARQRMDAPQFGGGYSPMEAEMFRQKLYAENAHNFQNTPQNPTAAEDFRRMLGMGPPNGNGSVPVPHGVPVQPASGAWPQNYQQSQGNPGYWLGRRLRSMMGF